MTSATRPRAVEAVSRLYHQFPAELPSLVGNLVEYLVDSSIGTSDYSQVRHRKTRTFRLRHRRNRWDMDHSHHNHGGMDMGDGGGDSAMCSMNVRLRTTSNATIHTTLLPRLCHLAHLQERRIPCKEMPSLTLTSTDALHMGHQQPLHRLQPMARNGDILPRDLHLGRDGADGGLRSYPGDVEELRGETGRED